MPLVDERGRKFSPGPLPSWQVRIVAGRRERVEQGGGGNTHCHTREVQTEPWTPPQPRPRRTTPPPGLGFPAQSRSPPCTPPRSPPSIPSRSPPRSSSPPANPSPTRKKSSSGDAPINTNGSPASYSSATAGLATPSSSLVTPPAHRQNKKGKKNKGGAGRRGGRRCIACRSPPRSSSRRSCSSLPSAGSGSNNSSAMRKYSSFTVLPSIPTSQQAREKTPEWDLSRRLSLGETSRNRDNMTPRYHYHDITKNETTENVGKEKVKKAEVKTVEEDTREKVDDDGVEDETAVWDAAAVAGKLAAVLSSLPAHPLDRAVAEMRNLDTGRSRALPPHSVTEILSRWSGLPRGCLAALQTRFPSRHQAGMTNYEDLLLFLDRKRQS